MMDCAELGCSEAEPGELCLLLLRPEELEEPLEGGGARKGEQPDNITY